MTWGAFPCGHFCSAFSFGLRLQIVWSSSANRVDMRYVGERVVIMGSFLHDSLRTEGKAGGWLQADRVQAIFYELLYYFGLIPEVMNDPFPTVDEL
jgi:hypothetical protein